jgi:type IV secretory pathway TrbD component
VPWTEIFTVFIVSHLVGDFLLQTDWQAQNKHGGLGADPVRRRALFSHIATYGLGFVPGFIWLASDIGVWVVVVALAVLVPHLVQDDGRLLRLYMRSVKRTMVAPTDVVYIAVDQTLHTIALFAVALAAS